LLKHGIPVSGPKIDIHWDSVDDDDDGDEAKIKTISKLGRCVDYGFDMFDS